MIPFSLWLWAAESFLTELRETGPKIDHTQREVITTKVVLFFLAPSPTSSQNQAHAQDDVCGEDGRILTRKKKTKSKNDERMKPSPSYTGPILTSLAALFAASGACVYAVNIQKIFGGMHREREREREFLSSFCVCVFLPSSSVGIKIRFSF